VHYNKVLLRYFSNSETWTHFKQNLEGNDHQKIKHLLLLDTFWVLLIPPKDKITIRKSGMFVWSILKNQVFLQIDTRYKIDNKKNLESTTMDISYRC
jgi:hypothetical protein